MRHAIGHFLVLALLLSGCAFVFPGHVHSEFTSKESVELQFFEVPKDQAEALSGAFAPALIGVAIDAIAKGLEKEAGRFEASYSARGSEHFYKSETSRELRYEGFALTRRAAPRSRGPLASVYPRIRRLPRQAEATSQLVFRFEPSDTGDTFRIHLVEAYLSRAKAKVLYPNWREYWWTRVPLAYGFLYDLANLVGLLDWGDGALDLDVSAQMDAVWIEKNKGHRASLGTLNAKLRDAPLGGGCSIDLEARGNRLVRVETGEAPPKLPDGHCKNLVSSKPISTGWIPALPQSKDGDKMIGMGSFDLSIKVSEFDEFKETVLKGAELVKKQRDDIQSQISGALDLGGAD